MPCSKTNFTPCTNRRKSQHGIRREVPL
jgi:hypothetical protein